MSIEEQVFSPIPQVIFGVNICCLSFVLGFASIFTPTKIPKGKHSFFLLLFFVLLCSLLLSQYLGVQSQIKSVSFATALIFMLLFLHLTFLLFLNRKKINRTNKKTEKQKSTKNAIPLKLYFFAFLILIAGAIGLLFSVYLALSLLKEVSKTYVINTRVFNSVCLGLLMSLPKLIFIILVLFRKQGNLAVLLVLSSCFFNNTFAYGILGLSFNGASWFVLHLSDLFWQIGILIFVFLLITIDKKIRRLDGFILLLMYLSYVIFLLYD